ncbi:MAG: hypothetical protein SCM11_12715 [Bacillota bacterium]|nr:hypothetical protein [Bacillota bacterium]
MGRRIKIPGLSFSMNRAFGVTAAKRRIAKSTGIPTSKQGRRAKVARVSGCLIPAITYFAISCAILLILL